MITDNFTQHNGMGYLRQNGGIVPFVLPYSIDPAKGDKHIGVSIFDRSKGAGVFALLLPRVYPTGHFPIFPTAVCEKRLNIVW